MKELKVVVNIGGIWYDTESGINFLNKDGYTAIVNGKEIPVELRNCTLSDEGADVLNSMGSWSIVNDINSWGSLDPDWKWVCEH